MLCRFRSATGNMDCECNHGGAVLRYSTNHESSPRHSLENSEFTPNDILRCPAKQLRQFSLFQALFC
ncbi:unnamed protein product [Heligmosomoides polygyrus]|uniref:Phlebovirus glycoprotein G2 fusion domain-containing protein n=1 Tax=Heligmosomoides polygyrus TaxID=6339 RepID=A0A183FPL7_HELPZ|nr:unnamed protein product [Heligmosomoides polygyrus]